MYLAAPFEQFSGIGKGSPTDEAQLHAALAEDQRANHVLVTGTVAIPDHGVLGVNHFDGPGDQPQNQLPGCSGGILDAL